MIQNINILKTGLKQTNLLTEGLTIPMGTVEAMEGLVLVFSEALGDSSSCRLGLIDMVKYYCLESVKQNVFAPNFEIALQTLH